MSRWECFDDSAINWGADLTDQFAELAVDDSADWGIDAGSARS